jgi:hypothetical protein
MPNSTQFAAQIGQLFGKAVVEGLWMTVVMFWGIFLAAWPAFLLLGAVAFVAHRYR